MSKVKIPAYVKKAKVRHVILFAYSYWYVNAFLYKVAAHIEWCRSATDTFSAVLKNEKDFLGYVSGSLVPIRPSVYSKASFLIFYPFQSFVFVTVPEHTRVYVSYTKSDIVYCLAGLIQVRFIIAVYKPMA